MTARDSKNAPKCWSQRLWWAFLLLFLPLAFIVLRNFSMGFWTFLACLAAFLGAGVFAGHLLGTYIDRHHRTEKGLLRQERRRSKAVHRWLRSILRRKGDRLEGPLQRKLEDRIGRFWELLDADTDRIKLQEERRRIEQFVEEHLRQFKKSPTREYIESIGGAVLIALFLRAFLIEAFQIPSGSMIPTLQVGDHIFVNKLSYGIRIPLLPLTIFGLRIPPVSLLNWSMPERGEVIVFITPENEEEDYIKRVVAVAGDIVEVRAGRLYLNGEAVPLEYGDIYEYRGLDEDGIFTGTVKTRMLRERLDSIEHPILRRSCSAHSHCYNMFPARCDLETGLCIPADHEPVTVPAGKVFVMGDNRDNSRDSRWWGTVPLNLIKGRAIFIWWSFREGLVRWERMFTRIR